MSKVEVGTGFQPLRFPCKHNTQSLFFWKAAKAVACGRDAKAQQGFKSV